MMTFWILISSIAWIAILYRWPDCWLPVVLAVMPILDLAPWTGQFFFDEYDLVLLLTSATVLLRRGWPLIKFSRFSWSHTSSVLFVLIGLSVFVSTVMGAWPFPALDINSFNNYLSPYNALRVAKGMGFAGLLLLMIAPDIQRDLDGTMAKFMLGVSLGLLGAALAVIWERLNFTGLLNFEDGYRAVGLFSGMHTGGAYVEGYLVTALPFVICWGMTAHNRWVKLCAFFIFILAGYALLVTYARGGYLAFILSCLVLFCSLLWRRHNRFKKNHGQVALIVLILVAGGLLFSYSATPMHERFKSLSPDSLTRVTHWQKIFGLMDQGWRTKLFGEGFGRFAQLYRNRTTGEQLSEYHFSQEHDKNYLQLSGGDPLYFEQIVYPQPGERYGLNFVARSKVNNAEVYLTLCQKWMFYANRCQWYRVRLNSSPDWRSFHFDVDANANGLTASRWYLQPTIKLSLANYQDGSALDVASISLLDRDQKDLIKNGDFTYGSRYWFFTTDNHLPWHYKNLFVEIYFEQGLAGLFLILALLLYSGKILVRAWLQDGAVAHAAPLLAASLVGFLTVGMVDSLFDFPRMSMLFYLLLMMVQFHNSKPVIADH